MSLKALATDISNLEDRFGVSIQIVEGGDEALSLLGTAIFDCDDAIIQKAKERNGKDGWKWTSFGKHFSKAEIHENSIELTGSKLQLIYGSSSPFNYEDQVYTCTFEYDIKDYSGNVVGVKLTPQLSLC